MAKRLERGHWQARAARRATRTPTATARACSSCWRRSAKTAQPNGSIYDARAAVEMIVAVFESHRLGGPAELPLKNRQNPLTML